MHTVDTPAQNGPRSYRITAFAAVILLLPIVLSAQDVSDSTSTTLPKPDTVTVSSVKSGTQFVASTGQTISLLGITTPKSQAISGDDAKEHLESLIGGDSIVLVRDTLAPPDKGKTLARMVYLLDGTLINLKMIADGYGEVSAKEKHSMIAVFKEAQSTAKSSGNGAYAIERSTAVQCSGTTQKGSRCKRTTKNLSGKCWQHE